MAVKLIERSADGAREREFAREVEMMRVCSLDPNIVPFYGVVLTQRHMGLVAEYMEVRLHVRHGARAATATCMTFEKHPLLAYDVVLAAA